MTRAKIIGFLAQHRGATAIEYGLIAAGIAVAIAAAVFTLGGSTSDLFGGTARSLGGGGGSETIASMTFDSGEEGSGNWTGGAIVDVPGFGNVLRLDNQNRGWPTPGSETVSTSFAVPEGSSSAILEFGMTFADSWDGEDGVIYVNGTEVGRGVYNWREGLGDPPELTLAGASGISIEMVEATSSQETGVSRFNAQGTDYSYRMRIEVEDPGTEVQLGFGTTLNSTGQWDESLLIDNIDVTAVR